MGVDPVLMRISESVREGVREGGFGARILCAGVIFPSKIQRIKNFKGGGGSQGLGRGGVYGPILGVISLCLGD